MLNSTKSTAVLSSSSTKTHHRSKSDISQSDFVPTPLPSGRASSDSDYVSIISFSVFSKLY